MEPQAQLIHDIRNVLVILQQELPTQDQMHLQMALKATNKIKDNLRQLQETLPEYTAHPEP